MTTFSIFDWRSLAVLRRNILVFVRNWKTVFLPPAFEPIAFFLAFGLGLGGYVGELQYGGRSVPYTDWVAPGLVAYTGFTTPFYEALYSSYVRMFYQKTWDGILATQVEIYHIVWGEILWASLRGAINATVVALVLLGMNLAGVIHIDVRAVALVPALVFVVAWSFSAFALIFTAIVPGIDHMNYPVFLIAVPLGLVSNTYFPLQSDHALLQLLIDINPVYHLAQTLRALLLGGPVFNSLWKLFATVGVVVVTLVPLVQRLIRRRVLG